VSREQRVADVEETIVLPSGRPVRRCVFELVHEWVERDHVIVADDDDADIAPEVNDDCLHILRTNAADVAAILLGAGRAH
jgi:hypothetical protein